MGLSLAARAMGSARKTFVVAILSRAVRRRPSVGREKSVWPASGIALVVRAKLNSMLKTDSRQGPPGRASYNLADQETETVTT
jgi:hypothetical protein